MDTNGKQHGQNLLGNLHEFGLHLDVNSVDFSLVGVQLVEDVLQHFLQLAKAINVSLEDLFQVERVISLVLFIGHCRRGRCGLLSVLLFQCSSSS